MFLGLDLDWWVADVVDCVLNGQTNKKEEEENESLFPYQAVTQFIVWKIKKEEKREEKKERVFCTVALTDVPLAATQSSLGSAPAGVVWGSFVGNKVCPVVGECHRLLLDYCASQ